MKRFLDQVVENLFPGYFSLVMATGIISVATYRLEMRTIAWTLLVINLAAYVILWSLTLLRLARFFPRLLADLTDHVRGIFPHLITGMVTAAGGAWNASIVAEYFHFKGRILSTTGLGATISHATDTGNFDLLLAATVVMAVTVVTINRLVWRRLYRLAETRYKLET